MIPPTIDSHSPYFASTSVLRLGGDSVKELRAHGINGVIELVALVPLANQKAAYGKMDGTSAANPFFGDIVANLPL